MVKQAVSAGRSGKPSTGGTRARSTVPFSTSALGSWQAGRGKMAEAGESDAGRAVQLSIIERTALFYSTMNLL